MKYRVLIVLFLLCGCAKPSGYAPVSGDIRDRNSESVYRACSHKIIKEYNDSEIPMTGGQVAGVIVGGVAGGAIGGAILGAALGSNDMDSRHTMKLEEINTLVDKCMIAHGYIIH